MRRISATTRLMVDAYHVLQDTVGVLANPERGPEMFASGEISRRVAS